LKSAIAALRAAGYAVTIKDGGVGGRS
jgi:hypothetical protein